MGKNIFNSCNERFLCFDKRKTNEPLKNAFPLPLNDILKQSTSSPSHRDDDLRQSQTHFVCETTKLRENKKERN